MTILRAQVESNEHGMCRCGQRATSELSYAEEMDQRQDASSVSPPSSPSTDQSYFTPPVEGEGCLVPVPEEVQLPSPTSSEEATIPIPPPRASTPGREVSGQRCWTRRKIDRPSGTGASGRLFWCSSGLRGKDRTRPYPAGRGEVGSRSGDSRLQAEQQLVTNWHFSCSFCLIFLKTYVLYLSRTYLIKVTYTHSNHSVCSLCQQIKRKHMYLVP